LDRHIVVGAIDLVTHTPSEIHEHAH